MSQIILSIKKENKNTADQETALRGISALAQSFRIASLQNAGLKPLQAQQAANQSQVPTAQANAGQSTPQQYPVYNSNGTVATPTHTVNPSDYKYFIKLNFGFVGVDPGNMSPIYQYGKVLMPGKMYIYYNAPGISVDAPTLGWVAPSDIIGLAQNIESRANDAIPFLEDVLAWKQAGKDLRELFQTKYPDKAGLYLFYSTASIDWLKDFLGKYYKMREDAQNLKQFGQQFANIKPGIPLQEQLK
ncbi:MAG: hypothetical protein QXV85_10660 [Candidatus Bathyarchaeia archaeon]